MLLLLCLAEVKPVTPRRSEAVNVHSHFFLSDVGQCIWRVFYFFQVKGQDSISLSHLDSLKRK